MKTISDFMIKKVESVDPSWNVLQVVALMKKKQIGSVLIKDQEKIIGIFTERDLISKIDLTRSGSLQFTNITDVMTPTVLTVRADESFIDAAKRMRKQKIRHLPVINDDKVVGIVSSRDLVEHYHEYLENSL